MSNIVFGFKAGTFCLLAIIERSLNIRRNVDLFPSPHLANSDKFNNAAEEFNSLMHTYKCELYKSL